MVFECGECLDLVFVKFSIIKNEIGEVFNSITLNCLHELCIWTWEYEVL